MQCPNPHCVLRRYGIIFFCPLILQQLLGREASASLLAALTSAPFGLSAGFVWLNARHSRLTGESSHAAPTPGQTESPPTKGEHQGSGSSVLTALNTPQIMAVPDWSHNFQCLICFLLHLWITQIQHTGAAVQRSQTRSCQQMRVLQNPEPPMLLRREAPPCGRTLVHPRPSNLLLMAVLFSQTPHAWSQKYSTHAAQARGVSMWPSPWRRRP